MIGTGHLFWAAFYPVIDLENHGSLNGFMAALNHILYIAIAGFAEERGTHLVPNEGRICHEADIVDYRDARSPRRTIL